MLQAYFLLAAFWCIIAALRVLCVPSGNRHIMCAACAAGRRANWKVQYDFFRRLFFSPHCQQLMPREIVERSN
uniref:Putative secreted protein n=1 Tax=Anopheles darlingi TaxID=43151 RepID=A0A2M4DF05_ANODA